MESETECISSYEEIESTDETKNTTKKRVRKAGVWSFKETKMLIPEVEKRELLWNNTIPEYRDKRKRQQAWDDIGDIVGHFGIHCRTRWDGIRNRFSTTYQKIQAKQGEKAAGRIKLPKFYASLQFLSPVIKTQYKTTMPNLDKESNTTDVTDYDFKRTNSPIPSPATEIGYARSHRKRQSSPGEPLVKIPKVLLPSPIQCRVEASQSNVILPVSTKNVSDILNAKADPLATLQQPDGADQLGNLVASSVRDKQEEINDGKYD